MSDRKVDVDLTKSTDVRISANDGNIPEERQKYRARLIEIRDRGLAFDRLNVDLPPEVYGEWVHNDPNFVNRLRLYGFEIDKQYATAKSLHDGGDGTAVVGDVVFMTIPKWKKEEMDLDARQRYHDMHLRDKRKGKEEKDFEIANRELGMPTTASSRLDDVSGAEIKESLTSAKE